MKPGRGRFARAKPLIGVVHLPPMPGFPGFPGIDALVAHALRDVEALEAAGFDGVLIENEHDKPHSVLAPRETTAAMARVVTAAVAAARRLRVGVEILLNDPEASLAVAAAAGAAFIRTDYWVDRMARDEYGGEMRADAAAVVAFRRRIGAEHVAILADVQVKYARLLVPRPLAASTGEAVAAGADGVVVTGTVTGIPPTHADLSGAAAGARAAAAGDLPTPIWIGSGLTPENAPEILALADGAIVGTGIMTDGKIDVAKARALNEVAERLRRGA